MKHERKFLLLLTVEGVGRLQDSRISYGDRRNDVIVPAALTVFAGIFWQRECMIVQDLFSRSLFARIDWTIFMRALYLTAFPLLLAAMLLLGSSQILSPSIASAANADVRVSDGVSDQDAILVRESIRVAQDYFSDRLGLDSDQVIVVQVLNSPDESDGETVAAASGNLIKVYTRSQGWEFGAPAERVATIVHEYTHIYQYLVLGDRDFESAAWFDEGFAEFVAIEALIDLGVLDQTSVLLYQAGLVEQYAQGLNLADLEDWDAFGEVGADAYPLSFFAVSNLLADRSLADVQKMYVGIANGQSFAEAFTSSYGLTPDAYYQEFSAGLASLQGSIDLPNDYAFNEGTDLNGPVKIVRAPDLSSADDQELVRAETLEGANCSLTLSPNTNGESTVTRDTFADGDGDVFWFVTIPADWEPGLADLSIECGGTPVVTTVEIGS